MLLASAVSLIESSQKIGRSHHRHGPGRDIFPAVLRERFDLVMALDRSEEVRGYSTQIGAIEMRAQLIEQVRHCRHHRGGIDISAGEFGSVFEKSLGQRVGSLREQEARSPAERGLLSPPRQR